MKTRFYRQLLIDNRLKKLNTATLNFSETKGFVFKKYLILI
jgi:hypothetical protein